MNALPTISVIMPSLNQGRYLEEAILSVIGQDHPSVELIVVDGGSSDNSVEVIRKYAGKIHYWISEKDRGQSHAINKGLGQATGEIVTWLNSDDVFVPGALTIASLHFLEVPYTGIFHGRALLFGKGRRNKVVGTDAALKPFEYLPYMRFPQPASFFRRSVIEICGPLNENLHYAMDHELVAKAVLLGTRIDRTAEVLAKYRLHGDSKSMNELPFLAEWSQVLINVFASVPGAQQFSSRLRNLLAAPMKSDQCYPATISLSETDLKHVFLEHLHLLFHAAYRQGDTERCNAIFREVMQTDATFAENKNYKRYLRRLKLVPAGVFKLYRRLAR